MTFYFAYGSNMDQRQMNDRCPSATFLGCASIKDYRLDFTIFSPLRKCGCADIVPSAGDVVHGLLYQMSEIDVETMDRFEGHPNHYRRISILVNGVHGDVTAYSYEVVKKIAGLRPSEHYLGLLQTAAEVHSFPLAYQNFLRDIKTLESSAVEN